MKVESVMRSCFAGEKSGAALVLPAGVLATVGGRGGANSEPD
jgi:hypothetical protein